MHTHDSHFELKPIRSTFRIRFRIYYQRFELSQYIKLVESKSLDSTMQDIQIKY